MNVKELLNNSPLSKDVIRQWFLEKCIKDTNSTKSIPEDFKKAFIEMGVNDEILVLSIENNPHCLFELLDENEIFIDVFSKLLKYSFNINCRENKFSFFTSRKLCEYKAVEEAIMILENKLKETNTNTNG